MRSPRNSLFTMFVFILVTAMLGCQKANDTAPPAAAVNGGDGKAGAATDAQAISTGDAIALKYEQDRKHPVYLIDTTAGKITVRLDAEKAPNTVDNFRRYAARGQYDATIFHQVVKKPVQIVLAGVYTTELKDKPASTPIRSEADNGLKNTRGSIAMLRRGDNEDSATCQFFFNIADNDLLNYKTRTPEGCGYCVFGEVTHGMEVLDGIANGPVHDSGTHPGVPTNTVAIRSVRPIQ